MIIRLTIDESQDYDQVEIIIKCPQINNRLNRIIKLIEQDCITLTGYKNQTTYKLFSEELYYVESVDNQTFLYSAEEVYESDLKLYELEELLMYTHFVRISKNLIVNTSYVQHVRALFNGKFEALLNNNEKVIVNRHYAKSFKEKFLK